MIPWEKLARGKAPDGVELELRRRGQEFLILAGGHDLMSSLDDESWSLAELGTAHIPRTRAARILVGGLGMGFTLREALDRVGPSSTVEVAELVPAVVEWNHADLGELADRPLDDERTKLHVGDVRERIRKGGKYDAILLDVDNGPDALAHARNDALYGARGLAEIREALVPGGVLGVWSFSDDRGFTDRLRIARLTPEVHRVTGSRKGRGRHHYVWVATCSA